MKVKLTMWKDVWKIVGSEVEVPDDFSLETLINMKLMNFRGDIEEVSRRAEK